MKKTRLLNILFLIPGRDILRNFLALLRFTEADACTLLTAYGLHALEVDHLLNNRSNEATKTARRFDERKGAIMNTRTRMKSFTNIVVEREHEAIEVFGPSIQFLFCDPKRWHRPSQGRRVLPGSGKAQAELRPPRTDHIEPI